MSKIIILAIESSCDDTSVSVIIDGEIKSNLISSQWIHMQYGGVVPEAASRQHVETIVSLCDQALKGAAISLQSLSAIAITRGPGLMGSLLVGISFAKSLSLCLNIPLIEVNHLHAHVLSLFIDQKPILPLVCLTVSGGHTQLLLVSENFKIELLGQTLDDAAGEAIDKTGKLLGLGYPAGPEMDKLALTGLPKFKFPIAKVNDFNFSFSGLKTSVLYFLRDKLDSNKEFINENLPDLCASIQDNIVKSLLNKLETAAIAQNAISIGIAGGVSANSQLRKEISQLCEKYNWNCCIPKMSYCTDNAAMIAIAGYHKYLNAEFSDDHFLPLARYPII
ncbi:MAG: tRNA (adenosine(37)-N6)-threonylcarbamoyltransferase complex transferase subunit TsaD [Saprospiraceae bacterium]|jgi:N6-L-threonylcarbamoyladenine synthase|nr:tRNA (adenosine(37)-N6)-threonylcarbamoyltransferase complex transferase subunit TsaD [Saprospiraceae bacterium]MBK8296043.1 tRNA (adenosine(37)-N6)-threonylcarbamoyltransferase complex transferase subunit TsaD [Saprospiraceae bacterium]